LEDNVTEAEVPLVLDTAEAILIDEGALAEDAEPTLVSSLSTPPTETIVVEETHEETHKDSAGVSASEPVADHLEEHKPIDELENIVNLLESVPLVKSEPATIIPDIIPDDMLEIPDEEEKHQ